MSLKSRAPSGDREIRGEERRCKERRFATSSPGNRAAATLAHEINNPLDSLQGILFLLKGKVTEEGRDYLTMAEEEVRRVSQIAYAALHASDDGPCVANTNVPRLMHSVIEFYNVRFEARGITVKSRYCTNGEISAHAGPLRQVFSNLLLNAVDSVPTGGQLQVRVAATRERSGQEREGVRVTIADNGCGIPPENLPKIVEPFFTTKGGRGSGLGLSLVKDVVHEHGGSLRVRSSTKPSHTGSIFSIFLPKKAA
jgi:two-component system CheB/CheR fusion protein